MKSPIITVVIMMSSSLETWFYYWSKMKIGNINFKPWINVLSFLIYTKEAHLRQSETLGKREYYIN
jgi:hypothetical protein